MSNFVAFTIVGIVSGSVYAVAASGLVVTYITSGIFNIAHGAIGMLMAFTYWELRINRNWPAPIALIMVVGILAPAFGAGVERVLMRNLRSASVGTSLVVTVGLMVALMGLANTIWDPGVARQMPRFFEPGGFELGSVFVTWHELITVLVGAAVAAALWFILRRTRTGIAMRAVVDDRNLTALNGAEPARLGMLAWALGSAMAAIAGILLAPVLQLNVLVLTLLVLNAYAAAMVGRLRNLLMTFVGGIALGLLESYAIGYLQFGGLLQGVRQSLPTLLMFVVLLLMPQAQLRAGRVVGALAPRAPDLKRSLRGALLFLVAAFVLSGMLSNANLIRVGTGLAIALVMLSLVLLTGYAGQVSLCQMTFAGLGAFAMSRVGGDGNVLGLVAAIVLAALVGALVALPALRLQGLYLALSTMAFAVLMDNIFFSHKKTFGTLGNINVGRLDLPGLSFEGERSFFMLLAFAFAGFALIVQWLRRGPFGRLLTAMRDSPVACAMLGLDLTRVKLAVFMISAGMAGAAGALFGGIRGSAGPLDFVMLQSVPVLLLAVLGGVTSPTGALIGGMVYGLLPVLQERFPSIGGFESLAVGLAAITLGRNPNGLVAMFARKGRARSSDEPSRAEDADPTPAPEVTFAAS